jgi:hypothetical protein
MKDVCKLKFVVPLVVIALFAISAPTFGGLEIGVGVMVPGGGGSIIGDPVFVPNAVFGLGPFAVGVDLWASPRNDIFFLLPFLELRIPLAVASVYAGIAPTIIGSTEGFGLQPPPLDLNVKIGVSGSLLMFSVFGEVVVNGVPAFTTISSISLVAGARFSL